MNLVLIEPVELDRGSHVRLDGERARHLIDVLKVAVGSRVRVGLIDGPRGRATIVAAAGASVTLACEFDQEVPDRPAVDLLLAVPRPKVLRRLWAQMAALGVGRIMLTNAERVERPYFDTHVLREQHWRPLLIEGLQQARDTRLPVVTVHRRFRILVEDDLDNLSDASTRLLADPGSDGRIGAVVPRDAHARVMLAVGPEGGWNDFERRLLESRGFVPVGLGPRALRSDTACVALLALVHERLRERPHAPAAGPVDGLPPGPAGPTAGAPNV